MRLLVCGGRDFGNNVVERSIILGTLDAVHRLQGITLLMHGGAPGADSVAHDWASGRRIPIRVFKADWKALGRQAGPIRNREMLAKGKPDLVIAFPGGRGTAHMVHIARAASTSVRTIPR